MFVRGYIISREVPILELPAFLEAELDQVLYSMSLEPGSGIDPLR